MGLIGKNAPHVAHARQACTGLAVQVFPPVLAYLAKTVLPENMQKDAHPRPLVHARHVLVVQRELTDLDVLVCRLVYANPVFHAKQVDILSIVMTHQKGSVFCVLQDLTPLLVLFHALLARKESRTLQMLAVQNALPAVVAPVLARHESWPVQSMQTAIVSHVSSPLFQSLCPRAHGSALQATTNHKISASPAQPTMQTPQRQLRQAVPLESTLSHAHQNQMGHACPVQINH